MTVEWMVLKKWKNEALCETSMSSNRRQINIPSILKSFRAVLIAIWNTKQHKYKIDINNLKIFPNTAEQFTQTLSSPKIMVVMATVWGSRQYLTLEALKTLHADCAITRSDKDFGHICGAELHLPNKVTSSLLHGHNRQTQACKV